MFLSIFFQAAFANEILLTSFTPKSLDDLAVAERLERDFLVALRSQELQVISPITLLEEYPDIAIGCAEIPECPSILMSREGSKILIVSTISSDDAGHHIVMRFYGTGNPNPLDVRDVRLSDSEVDSFLIAMAQDVSVLQQLLPTQEQVAEPIIEEKFVEPVVTLEKDPPTSDIRVDRLPSGASEDYYSQYIGADEWLKEARVRSGNITLEIFSGAVFGDVTHRYDTRVGFEADGESAYGIYKYDSFLPGYGAIFGGSIGFMPLWWLEISVSGGASLVQKELSTGWEQRNANGEVSPNNYPYDPVMAGYGELEPRLKFYLLPTGPVKPYVLMGSTIRFYDGYVVQDLKTVDYENTVGGTHAGIMAGGGLSFDSAGPVGVFVDVPWTYMLNQETYEETTGEIVHKPEHTTVSSNMLTKIRVGMSLRFH